MLNAVFLDFGDTLISEQVFISHGRKAAVNFLCDHYHWEHSSDALQERFLRIEAGLWLRWGHRPPAVKEEAIRLAGIEYLIREAGAEPDCEAVEGAFHHLIAGSSTSPCLLDSARETVHELSRHYRLAIVSNGLDAYTRLCLEHHDLMRYFEVYTISEKANVEKPDPAILRLTMDQMRVRPQETVMVGNRSDVDVLCANRAGCHSIWYRHPGSLEHPEAHPDFTISSLVELPARCNQLSAQRQAF